MALINEMERKVVLVYFSHLENPLLADDGMLLRTYPRSWTDGFLGGQPRVASIKRDQKELALKTTLLFVLRHQHLWENRNGNHSTVSPKQAVDLNEGK